MGIEQDVIKTMLRGLEHMLDTVDRTTCCRNVHLDGAATVELHQLSGMSEPGFRAVLQI